MKLARIVAGGLALACFLVGGSAVAAEEDVTLRGQFIWERSDGAIPGDLEAIFTPTGENAWDVMFHFEWEGERRAWAGNATGNLKSGDLEGQATEERDRKRTFVFHGSFEDGVFTGEHGSLRDGKMRKSGTLTFE